MTTRDDIKKVFMCAALLVSAGSIVVQATSLCPVSHCLSTVQVNSASTPAVYIMCPAGDTGSFSEQGFTLSLQLLEQGGFSPAVGWPTGDVEVRPCVGATSPAICAGTVANPDHDTDANGVTVMADARLVGGGCADGFAIYVWCDAPPFLPYFKPLFADSCATGEVFCAEVYVRSPDMTGDGAVNLLDLSEFASAYEPSGGQYNPCADMNMDGEIDLFDLATLAFHFGPPGHACP